MMETRSAKRRKMLSLKYRILTAEGGQGGIDHISNLPDDVLHRILGFLPIETIARMSILSKRWTQIWRSFPDLDFTTIRQKNPDQLKVMDNLVRSMSRLHRFDRQRVRNFLYLCDRDFIRDVLSVRDKGSNLRALRVGAFLSFTCLNKLIREALKQNVRELDIEFATEDYFNMPKCIILSESLRVLNFKPQFPGFRLPFLSVMKGGFQSPLQVLSLSLLLIEGELDIFTDSVFPVLRKLSLSEFMHLRQIKVSCSALEDMTLEKCSELDTLEVVGSRLERLRVASCFHSLRGKSMVKVHAARLRVLEWEQNHLTEDCLLQNLTALHQASLYGLTKFHEFAPPAIKLRAAWNFLHGLCHVQCLKLDTPCMKLLQQLAEKNYGPLLPFINLETLELRTVLTRNNIVPALDLLFKSSPSLCSLILTNTDYCSYERSERKDKDWWDATSLEEEKNWETQMTAMTSFLEKLKVVKIHGFSGCKGDVSLAKFLLRHGKALEEIVLCYGNERNSLLEKKIKSQMMEFSAAASSAKILFE
ncbi:putative F-box/FBD/LRR-repeat protein At4g03220 [Punica granatum]|uniref:F-box/FBD/LRR-repeat protein At4g03220 n=1 Tax=Punica granatum TaxID=22663 RepID=A0A218Y1K8_PUNGR|nr:putative F-box/FBD/LRR-repeat protein At4g03220 [Punica granatum]OWM90970.1 hypothetical protein CDL15_Pgr023303 [Punica granatum]